MSRNLIQHFGISNPSPGYIRRVVSAFQTGLFRWEKDGETPIHYGDGRWGNLAATAAAIVLDQEAISVVLDADPTHGALKEPLVKVVGFMRAMNYRRNSYSKQSWDILKGSTMITQIGQMVFRAPNVFSFFSPQYSPPGRLAQASLLSPEAQALSTITTVGMTNGLFSLIKHGLTDSNGGFGSAGDRDWITRGYLAYIQESDAANSTQIIDDLATLLTSGRLSQTNRALIEAQYSGVFQSEGAEAALRVAQQLLVTTPEFHTTSLNRPSNGTRDPSEASGTTEESYKAIVYVYMFGGMDSFHMLAPHSGTDSGCTDLYEEYTSVRGLAGLEPSKMLLLNASSSDQPCNVFGLHNHLGKVQAMYDEGKALFFANTGHLAKPVSRQTWLAETRGQLFSHFHMMKEGGAYI